MDNDKLLAVLDRLTDKPVDPALSARAAVLYQELVRSTDVGALDQAAKRSIRQAAQDVAVTVEAAARVSNEQVFEALIERLGWSRRDTLAFYREALLADWFSQSQRFLSAELVSRAEQRVSRFCAIRPVALFAVPVNKAVESSALNFISAQAA